MPAAMIRTALLVAGLSLAAQALAAVNETPKKKTAFIFGPHNSALSVDERIEKWLCSENYTVTKYVSRPGFQPATLANLKAISTSGFGVLVILAHGASDGITVEECATEEDCDIAYDDYRSDPAYADIRGSITSDTFQDFGADAHGFAVGLNLAGLNKLFGGVDANRSIVAVLGCESIELRTGTPRAFGATEYLGMTGAIDQLTLAKATGGFQIMGGTKKIDNRPVVPAFDGLMLHDGPGNTTLAPACKQNVPAEDAVLPLKVQTDGKTIYETTMNTANVSIMSLEKDECVSALTNQAWANDTEHRFKIRPTKPGKIVFKVDPTLALSKNNDTFLIGNRFILPTELGVDARPPIDDCPFGLTGLDDQECTPPTRNPYRWCVWCKEKPIDPGQPGKPSKPEKPTKAHSEAPRRVPAGERDAFVIYQPEADSLTVIDVLALAPNMSFAQVGSWYGHLVFEPQEWQVGSIHNAQIFSHDINGPRDQGDLTWEVVARQNGLTAFVPEAELPSGDLGRSIIRPGDTAQYQFTLVNSGNTVLQGIVFATPLIAGPEPIPPPSVTVSPNTIDLLQPGEAVQISLEIQTHPLQQSGLYTGMLQVSGSASDGPVMTSANFLLNVNRPPYVSGPADTMHVDIGQPVSIPLSMGDPDFDLLRAAIDRSQYGGQLVVSGNALSFAWTPPEDAAGFRAFPIVAYDGLALTVHELHFQVGPVASVPESPALIAFSAGPNPATRQIAFTIALDRSQRVEVEVFDPNGRLVARPVHESSVAPGRRTWTWSPQGLGSGVYFARARIGLQTETRRIIWLGAQGR